MNQITSFLTQASVPLSMKNLKMTPEEHEALSIACGCPINKKTPTKMTRETFRRMCMKFQKYNDGNKMNLHGFKSINYACLKCSIGLRVKNGWSLSKYPLNIEIVEFESYKEPPQGCKKLSTIEVLQMRALYEKGTTIKELCDKFKRKRGTVSDVVHRKTWTHI